MFVCNYVTRQEHFSHKGWCGIHGCTLSKYLKEEVACVINKVFRIIILHHRTINNDYTTVK